jgi:hypothetical protein
LNQAVRAMPVRGVTKFDAESGLETSPSLVRAERVSIVRWINFVRGVDLGSQFRARSKLAPQ